MLRKSDFNLSGNELYCRRLKGNNNNMIRLTKDTSWSNWNFEEFSEVFRIGMRDGKECEMFTLLGRDLEYAYLWGNLFKNSDVEYVSYISSVINTNKKNKRIEILPLVYCKYDSKSGTFRYTYL